MFQPSSFPSPGLWQYIYSFLPATPGKQFLIPSCLFLLLIFIAHEFNGFFPHTLSFFIVRVYKRKNAVEQNWYCIKKRGMKKCLQERARSDPVPLTLTPISAFAWLSWDDHHSNMGIRLPSVAHRPPFMWHFLPPPWYGNQVRGSTGCGEILLWPVTLASRQLPDKMDMDVFLTFLPKTGDVSIRVTIIFLGVKPIKYMGASSL